MMGTLPQLIGLENIVAKITHRSSLAPTIHYTSGFALTILSVVVASLLLGSLRTQVRCFFILFYFLVEDNK